MVLDQLAGAADGVDDRVAVAGKRDLGRQLDRPLERLEEVAERIGPAGRPEPDGRRDPAEQVVGRDEHAPLQQAELPVGVPGRGDELPAVEAVAVVDEDRVALEADERPVDVARADQLLGDLARDAVGAEPLGDPLGPVRVPPDELALRVVERALVHGRPRQLGDVGGRADVVGVEVGDEDPRHLGVRRATPARPPARPAARSRCRRASSRPRPAAGTSGRARDASAAAS